MRIDSISHCYFNKKNNTSPNFKAQVMIVPSCAEAGQPQEDKFILQRSVEEIKEELQSEFPDKDDNILILLQADGYRTDSNQYRNGIKAYIGYKDPERARTEMLEMQKDLSPDERFYDYTIEKLKTKDSNMMKKLNDKYSIESREYLKNDIKDNIKLHFVDNIKDIVEELPYYIAEPPGTKTSVPKEQPVQPPLWWRILMGDPGAP